nr:uncharacterized protein LOC111515824 [Leptinotarsa decemlineata]
MPNIRGPDSDKRAVLGGVVQFILLYGAPIWYLAMRMEKYRQILTKTQRKSLVRIISAYRTVSAEAAQVVARMIPIDLLAAERKYTHERSGDEALAARRRRAREITMDKWQERWDNIQEKAQWTKKLVPSVKDWMVLKDRRTNYFATQLLTGHGSFGSYTHRIGRTPGEECAYCRNERDDAEHTLFLCPRWTAERQTLQAGIGEPLAIEKFVVTRNNNWREFRKYANTVMAIKEREERKRQQQQE